MGHTTTQSKLIIALGASSISDAWTSFIQNNVTVEDYQNKISQGLFPIENGHLLSEEDLIIRKNILDLMCRNNTTIDKNTFDIQSFSAIKNELKKLEEDGLVKTTNDSISVTEKGNLFIRNISSILDSRMRRKKAEGNVFSKSI